MTRLEKTAGQLKKAEKSLAQLIAPAGYNIDEIVLALGIFGEAQFAHHQAVIEAKEAVIRGLMEDIPTKKVDNIPGKG